LEAGLPANVNPHSIRRAAITLVIDSGASMEGARDFAGHADTRVTAAYHPTRGARGMHGAFTVAAALAAVA